MAHDRLVPIARDLHGACRCQPCPSRRTGVCGAMGQGAFAILGPLARLIALPRDHMLIGEDTPAAAVWIVRRGVLRVQRYGADGRRQIMGLFLPGEVTEKLLTDRAGTCVETATAVELCRLDRRAFAEVLAREPGLRRALTQQRLARLGRMRWMIWALGALRPDERICAFLALATRFLPVQPLPDGTLALTVSLPRSDIADLLGTSAETYSRVTHRLQDAGVIDILDPEHFRIHALDALIRKGCAEQAFRTLPFPDRGGAGTAVDTAFQPV
ncbi:Crp/Fnr family transcriptional regulator [Pontitalea aquivivens]|uniref:Crp/Fnr family transcriptional regulator n=1 Tax=Pontitalea aquivivens TaxID=3388663 RepID=UPI00397092C9